MPFDLLTWISIGVIHWSRTIYLPSLKPLGQSFFDWLIVVLRHIQRYFSYNGAKRFCIISCTSWRRLAWYLTLTFDLLTWISIGVIYSSRTIYLPSLMPLGQSILELSVEQGEVDWHDLWPLTWISIGIIHWSRTIYLPSLKPLGQSFFDWLIVVLRHIQRYFSYIGAKRFCIISCTSWRRLAWHLTLTFDLLTWIAIGVIYSSRTIYLLRLKPLRQSVLELSVAQGEVDWHHLWPWPLTCWRK